MNAAELAQARARLGLTQAELADALGVAPNTIARWEQGTGKIGQPAMLRLALERLEEQHQARLTAALA